MARQLHRAVDAEPGGELNIGPYVPEGLNREQLYELYDRDAETLGRWLTRTLPGGTIDQLTIWLLHQAASRLVVRHPGGDTPEDQERLAREITGV